MLTKLVISIFLGVAVSGTLLEEALFWYNGTIELKIHMQLLLRHPVLTTMTVTSFLPWYLGLAPKQICKRCGEYASALAEIFAFVFLLKTLLSPWKAIRGEFPKRGFNISLMSQAIILDITSRVIGMLIRLGLMFIGLCMEIVLFAGTAVLLIIWYGFPVVLIANLLYLL